MAVHGFACRIWAAVDAVGGADGLPLLGWSGRPRDNVGTERDVAGVGRDEECCVYEVPFEFPVWVGRMGSDDLRRLEEDMDCRGADDEDLEGRFAVAGNWSELALNDPRRELGDEDPGEDPLDDRRSCEECFIKGAVGGSRGISWT